MGRLRPNGYYWIVEQEFGAVRIVLYLDGIWKQSPDLLEDEVEVIEGPLPLPTAKQIAGQAEHFAERNRMESLQYGVNDATWEGALNGDYWVRQQGHNELEIAACYEGNWRGLNWDDGIMWSGDHGAPTPTVVFGPIDEPSDARPLHS